MRTIRTSGLTGLLAVCAAGCSEPIAKPLRLGLCPSPSHELLQIAADDGLFTAAGLDVQVVELRSYAEIARAYADGEVDAMATSLLEVHEVMQRRERNPQVLLATAYSAGGLVLAAREPIEKVADLRGKPVAFAAGTFEALILARALARNDMQLADVRSATSGDEVARLRDGRIAAAVLTARAAAEIEGVRTLFSSKDMPGEVVDVVAVDAARLDDRPDLGLRMQDAWARALQVLANERTKTIQRMATRLKVTGAELEQTLTQLELVGVAGQAKLLSRAGTVHKTLTALGAGRTPAPEVGASPNGEGR